jgi:hypothetical protein
MDSVCQQLSFADCSEGGKELVHSQLALQFESNLHTKSYGTELMYLVQSGVFHPELSSLALAPISGDRQHGYRRPSYPLWVRCRRYPESWIHNLPGASDECLQDLYGVIILRMRVACLPTESILER